MENTQNKSQTMKKKLKIKGRGNKGESGVKESRVVEESLEANVVDDFELLEQIYREREVEKRQLE